MKPKLICLFLLCMAARASAMTISLDEFANQAACNNPIGVIHITVSGGVEPYSYSWSDGSILEDRDGLPPGDYTVTVTDNVGAVASDTYMIVGSPWLIVQFTQAQSMPCPNEANGSAILITSEFSGVPPYSITATRNGTTVQSTENDMWGNPIYSGFALGDVFAVSATDALGCSGSHTQPIYGPDDTPVEITTIQGECIGTLGHVVISSAALPTPPSVSVWNDQGVMIYYSPDFSFVGTVSGLAAGDYMLKQSWWGLLMEPCDTIYIPFTIPYLGALCGTVQGTSWYDVDGDCVQDASEVGVPYNTLLIEPGSQAVLTSGGGTFSFPLVNGAYTLEQTDPTLIPICPVVQPVPLTVNSNITTVAFANGSTEPLDLAIYAGGTEAHPGFITSVHATVRNLSPQVSGPVTVSITFDPLLVFGSALPTPTSVIGNVVTWDFAAFTSFQDEDVHLSLTVPPGTPLGTTLAYTAAASNTLIESTATNNSTSWNRAVTGSFDPNDKVARTSSGLSDALYFIDLDEWVDYTIRFQNTGTAAASFVVITDTLGAEFDMLTFEQGTASHPFEVSFKPGRVVEWRFDPINLPDSASDEPGSHGLVHFRIRLAQPLLAGSIISNTANIFFDFNDPVITEPSVLTAEFSTGVDDGARNHQQLYPNPASDRLRLVDAHLAAAASAWSISSADGRVVSTSASRYSSDGIDVAGLAEGSYLLRIHTASGPFVLHFVKTR